MKKILALVLITMILACGCDSLPEGDISDGTQADETIDFTPSNDSFGVAYAKGASLDPYTTPNELNHELAGLLCEGLFSVGEDFSVTPVLCSEYSYNNGVYTFKLKDGVTFSDGSPLTATDVEYSLNAAREQGSYYALRLSSVTNVRAQGSGTVNITLSRENARLPALLDVPIIKKGTRGNALPVGTGQYAPSADGKSLVSRSNHHSGKKPLFSTINLVDIRSTDELIFEFEAGNVSLLTSDPTGQNSLKADGINETRNISTTQLHYLGFNAADPALSDPAVRRRIACAIDRTSVAEQDFALMGVAAEMPVHPKSASYPREAANLLAYDSETPISVSKPLTILVNSENSGKLAACKRIAESLSSLGAPTTVRALPFNEYAAALSRGDFTLYYAEVTLGADFDITRLLAGPLNYGKFYDESLLSLNTSQLAAAEAESDFYNKFAELCPFAPIMFKDTSLTTQRGFFTQIHATSQNIYNAFWDWRLGG